MAKFLSFGIPNEDWFLVFGMPNAKHLAFGTPDGRTLMQLLKKGEGLAFGIPDGRTLMQLLKKGEGGVGGEEKFIF